MMIVFRCLCLVLIVVFLQTNPQSAIRSPHFHKFHVTNSTLEYNPAEKSVEIVVRVFVDDFQSALSKFSGSDFKCDRPEHWKDKAKAAVILNYLNTNFVLKNKAGRPVKFTWVGMEGVADMFWLYIEGRMPGGLDGAQLKNRIHCELFDDQVNVVNAKQQGKQTGLMFEPKDEFKAVTIAK